MTGGAVGGRGATFWQKSAILKAGIREMCRVLPLRGRAANAGMAAARFVVHDDDIRSAGPCGFDHMQGVRRRPLLDQLPGIDQVLITLLLYARQAADKLNCRMP